MKTIRNVAFLSGLVALHPLAAMINPEAFPLQTAALKKAFPTKEEKTKEHRLALLEVAQIEEQLKALSTQIEKFGDKLGLSDEIHGIADSLKTKAAVIKALTKCGMEQELQKMEEAREEKE
jgi:archaellum component FlaC